MSARSRGNARRRGAPVAALALAAALALSLPAGASASVRTLRGKLDGGGTVRFELKRTENGTRKIANWRWRNFRVVCDNETAGYLDGQFNPPALRVRSDRSFYGEALRDDGKGSATLYGEFPEGSWRRSSGTFQIEGTTPVGTNCETGAVSWSAKRI
jgi:hypothetical protein